MISYGNSRKDKFLKYGETAGAPSWCVVRQLPTLQSMTVAQFFSRLDAENHLKILKNLHPGTFFEVVFDVPFE